MDAMNVFPNALLRAVRPAARLLLVALVPALLAATFHPRRPAWSKDQAMVPETAWSTVQRWRGLVLVIDARNTAAFARQHIPGALPLREKHWEEQLPAMIKAWRPGAKVVVYCDNEVCTTSQSVARRLRRDLGNNDVFVLKGGWGAWLEAQKPGK